jgi:hypothetical protein
MFGPRQHWDIHLVRSAMVYSTESRAEGDRAARCGGPQTIANEISRRNEMTLQFGDTASGFKRNNDSRPINWVSARGEDIIIAGVISEWV